MFSYEDFKNGNTVSTEPSIALNKEKEDLPLPPVKVGLVRKLTLFNGDMLIGQINVEEVRNKQQNKNYPFMVKIEPSQGFNSGGVVSFDVFVNYTMGKNWEKVAFKKEEEKQELPDNEDEYLPLLEDEVK